MAVACMYRQDPAVACMYRQDPKQTLRDAPAPVCARTCLAAAATRSGGRAGRASVDGLCAGGAKHGLEALVDRLAAPARITRARRAALRRGGGRV